MADERQIEDSQGASPEALVDMSWLRVRIGGTRPVDASTIHKMVQDGKLPPPIKYSRRIARWKKSVIEIALAELAQREAEREAEKKQG